MADTDSTYKGYLLMETGSHPAEWGQLLNDDVISAVDYNLGGITSKSLSNSNVALSVVESAAACLRLTGVLTTNLTVTASGNGFYFVENLTTGGFTVTLLHATGSNFVTMAQGLRSVIFGDATLGYRPATVLASDATQAFPTSTRTLFPQTSVPTGWTLVTTWNDYGLRIVNTTGGTTSGINAFSTTFGQTTTGDHTVTLAEYPSHQHQYTTTARTSIAGTVAHADWNGRDSSVGTPTAQWSSTGNTTGHAHAVDLRLRYMTTVVGQRAA